MNNPDKLFIGILKKLIVLLLLISPLLADANNVRIVEQASVDPMAIKDDIVSVKMKIAWDNSWRDDFNHDAVYIFIKYRLKGTKEWKHAYFMDGGHGLPGGYEYNTAKSLTTANHCMGLFVQRKNNGIGVSNESVSMQLKWNIKTYLTQQNFIDDKVEYHASCIEMIYVPQGAFCLGDGISKNSFQINYRPILPEWDLIKNDGVMTFFAEGGNSTINPAINAANRINENRSAYTANAWQAATGEASWQVDFKEPKTIRYFGVSGVKGREAFRPITWAFEGKNPNSDWRELWRGGMNSWYIGENSYPVQRAIQVPPDKQRPYQMYRVKIITPNGGNLSLANNIAMTEVDMSTKTNDAYVMDKDRGVKLDTFNNLKVPGDNWFGTMDQNYPTGFNGFYAMKYEITQEQWVRFLNKLEYKQQKQRTVGNKLDELLPGDFVYGDKNRPNARNGIAVGARVDGNIVFVNNLNPNNEFAQPDDGQTIACNYLSAEDMLAYADWCGLRPLSEMEYEKMARAPYPAIPKQKEWAGGEYNFIVIPASNSISSPRKNDETINNNGGLKVNVNAGGALDGPVRAGAFSASGGSSQLTGVGFWGVAELSGNLAEIYYKCSVEGRKFSDALIYHGNGTLIGNSAANPGNSDMDVNKWPRSASAFILRGGSFKSNREQIAISDRSMEYTAEMGTERDSTVSFRLGHSFARLLGDENNPETFLTLANGLRSLANPIAVDSVCAGSPYIIEGTAINEINKPTTRYSFIWYKSENNGITWDILRGYEGQNLTYNEFYNDGAEPREIWFKRRTIGTNWWSETNHVILRIINTGFEFNRISDTITMANHSLGYWVDTKAKARFTWKWKSSSGTYILQDAKFNDDWDFYAPKRRDFKNMTGEQVLICEMNMLNRCIKRQELKLTVVPRPTVGVDPAKIAIGASDPQFECGAVMQDNRSTNSIREVYVTVRIGDQCWMAENLRYPISGMSTQTAPETPIEIYGHLYKASRELVATVCPQGWRVPKPEDWTELIQFLNADGSNRVGAKLKQGAYWLVNNKSYKAHLGTNESGFGAAGTGYMDKNKNYLNNEKHTYYGSQINMNSYYHLSYNNSDYTHNVPRQYFSWGGGYGYNYNTDLIWIVRGYGYLGWTSHSYYFPIRCLKN